MPDDPYTLAELARLADVTPRTVRYYVAQGLLPSPGAAGPSTRYGEGHLARLRLIRRLQREHLPLAEIRARLERIGDEEVQAALDAAGPSTPEPPIGTDATLAYVRDLMTRAGVAPRFYDQPAGPPADASRSPAEAASPAAGDALPAASETPAPALPLLPMPAPWNVPSAPSLQASVRLRTVPAPASPPVEPMSSPGESVPPPVEPVSLPAGLAPTGPVPAAQSAGAPSRSTTGDRTTWERLVITPDVELHVRRPLDRTTNKRVDRLERIARELFEEDA